MPYKPATILASQTRLMKSKFTKRQYRISIALPYAYYELPGASWPFDKPLKKWPVVYLTDANYYFGLVTDMVRVMAWCGKPTDAIIVGIGYKEQSVPQKAWQDSIAWRESDFTPVRVESEEKETGEWLQRRVVTEAVVALHGEDLVLFVAGKQARQFGADECRGPRDGVQGADDG